MLRPRGGYGAKSEEFYVIISSLFAPIGGDAEERAADYIKANVSKPVVGYALRDYLKGFRKGFGLRPAWYGGGTKYWWLEK